MLLFISHMTDEKINHSFYKYVLGVYGAPIIMAGVKGSESTRKGKLEWTHHSMQS